MVDLPFDVYKDWLYEFNNNDDLRDIDFASLLVGDFTHLSADENEDHMSNNDYYAFDYTGNASVWSTEFEYYSDGDDNGIGTRGVGNFNTMDLFEGDAPCEEYMSVHWD